MFVSINNSEDENMFFGNVRKRLTDSALDSGFTLVSAEYDYPKDDSKHHQPDHPFTLRKIYGKHFF
jgi:hypothetical protein